MFEVQFEDIRLGSVFFWNDTEYVKIPEMVLHTSDGWFIVNCIMIEKQKDEWTCPKHFVDFFIPNSIVQCDDSQPTFPRHTRQI